MSAGFEILLAALLLPVASDTLSPPLATPDSTRPLPRVVRTLDVFTVRGSPIVDPLSNQSVQRVESSAIRALPFDRLAAIVGLQTGVVAGAEDLHVRGGRAGELAIELEGLPLSEPFRGRPLELPLLAIRTADLITGGIEADHAGGLAGALSLTTVEPGDRVGGTVEWRTDGRLGTHYDRVAGQVRTPLGPAFGVVATAEATLDDSAWPALRSNARREIGGLALGWRADNRMLGHVKIAARDPRVTLEILAGRRVYQPFDPIWSLDGWTRPCEDDSCLRGPGFRSQETAGFTRWRAADHSTMTDESHLFSMLSWRNHWKSQWLATSIAWAGTRSITSLNGRDDESYLTEERAPQFGSVDSPTSEPFYVYGGDEPWFRKTRSSRASMQASWQAATRRGDLFKAGAGASLDEVELRELDVSIRHFGLDSLRSYHAWAPGGWAYGNARWAFEGLVANLGLRLQLFTAGPQAESQSVGDPARAFWTLSPRVGISYPLSVRDVFSLSYVRLHQAPPRDLLYDDRATISNRQPLGNPASTATVISYQAAAKHLLGERWSLQASLFYRDVFGLPGARKRRNPRLTPALLVYESVDEAHALGWELSVLRVEGEFSRVEAHYTWLIAQGTESSEEGVPYGPRLFTRPESIGPHPLAWDRRHSVSLVAFHRVRSASLAWTTAVGSPLPWTPRERRTLEADVSRENSRRLGWQETSTVAARWTPPYGGGKLTLGLDVNNVFDNRAEVAATVDGYPHREINTTYDDYGAFRTETGLGGGAYWNDGNDDGLPGWRRINDPRLFAPPRTTRLFLSAAW